MHAKSLKEVFFSQSGMPENTTKMNEMFERIFIENNFSQNDRKVFNLYFNEAKDYATIGKEIGLSRERIRVIFNKIVRIVSQRETLKRFFENEQEFYNNLRKNKPFKIPVREANLNGKTKKALERAGYYFLEDLIGMSEKEIKNINRIHYGYYEIKRELDFYYGKEK